MRERVLVISNMYPTAADRSHGSFVARCVHSLQQQGVEVDTAVLVRPGSRWLLLPAYLRFAWQANCRILCARDAVVWIHHPLHSLLASLPALWLRSGKVVLNFHGHDLLPLTRRGRWLQTLLAGQFRQAAVVLLPSRRFQQIFDSRYGGGRSQVFPSGGVQLHHLAPAPPLAMRTGGVLFLSRWVEGKGWPEMLDIARMLAAQASSLDVTIAGVGPDGDRIRRAISGSGLAGRIRIIHCDDARRAAALMRAHRFFVLPTRYEESLALVNLEAMSAGCVVISRDFAAARDYIVQGRTGYRLAAPRFAHSCVELLLHLNAKLPSAQQIATAARHAAAEWSDFRVMAALPGLLGLTGAEHNFVTAHLPESAGASE